MKNLADYTNTELKDEFKRRGELAIIWSVVDVQYQAREDADEEDEEKNLLTDEGARKVLEFLDAGHDANYGICWDSISAAIGEVVFKK